MLIEIIVNGNKITKYTSLWQEHLVQKVQTCISFKVMEYNTNNKENKQINNNNKNNFKMLFLCSFIEKKCCTIS